MALQKRKKKVTVKEHARRVPVSTKNPSGKTLVDRHFRYIDGCFLTRNLIEEIFSNYAKDDLIFPKNNELLGPNQNKYSR